jgi:hypothetical protein
MKLPDGSKPWGGTTSCNAAAHTGCHVHVSDDTDDIFLAARDKNVKSVYSGGAKSYSVFKTADFNYAGTFKEVEVVQKAIDHFTKDNTRLIRLHGQRPRDSWNGPQGRSDPNSKYIKSVVTADNALGNLIKVLKDKGVWDSTFLMITADHGMGKTSKSDHPANVLSSWSPFISFYGPGLKRGKTIPYAELPDLAIMTAHFLGLRPLRGHTNPKDNISPKGTTGTFLVNLFENSPNDFSHPKYIEAYLKSTGMKPSGSYGDYHTGIVPLLQPTTALLPRFPFFHYRNWLHAQSGYIIRFTNKRGYPVIANRGRESGRGLIWSVKGRRLYPAEIVK